MDDILTKASDDGFNFHEVTFSDVVLAIAHYSSQAKGEDGIPQSVIAKSLPVIGHHLATLFNASLTSGVFPGAWKRAHLVPLKKKAIPSAASDFRPIALLSFLSKVLEKIVHQKISEHLDSKNIMDPRQTGFRQHHSTQTALLRLTEDIPAGIDNEKQYLTILLLFDFSKAFDTISPSKLLRKLISMGFSKSVDLWVTSYITGRNQSVVTKLEGKSDWLTTNLGVPQGSVLGPLLISLYINDIKEVLFTLNDTDETLPDGVAHLLYADDLQIYTQVTRDNLRGGIDRLSVVARAVSAWASDNALHLNTGKTKAIIFGSKYNVNLLKGLNLSVVEVHDNVFAPFVETVTNLGVVMDSKLTWKPQVDAVSRKVNRALYGLRSFRSCTTEAFRKQLVNVLAISHLDYCSVVYLDVADDLHTRLQRLQNSCVRYVCGVRRDEHITPYRKKLEWMDMRARREYLMGVRLYKAFSMRQPSYLTALFVKNESRTSGRAPRQITVPGSRTDTGLESFRARGARLWNSLPQSIRNVHSLRKFKLALREHLLSPTLS